jgi:hypothetical protein
MARMRPKAPKLLRADYGRADYLRREVQLAKDYQDLHPTSAGATAIDTFLTAAAPAAEPLPGDQAIVEDGQTFEVDGGTVTLSVADGVVSASFEAEE